MNENKSTIVRLVSVAHSDFTLLSGKNFNWSGVRSISLGINLSTETSEIPDMNYSERIQKITTCLNVWNLKGLLTLGRVLIVKSVAIWGLIYQLSMLPTLVKIVSIKSEINYTSLYGTIRRDKMKRKVMNQDYTLGRCKMIDITVQNKALKLSWIPFTLGNIDSFWVQCLQANLHFPIKHILPGNLNKKAMENVWVIV